MTLGINIAGSPLSNCDCYKYEKNLNQIIIDLPIYWSKELTYDSIKVILSYGNNVSNYEIPVIIES